MVGHNWESGETEGITGISGLRSHHLGSNPGIRQLWAQLPLDTDGTSDWMLDATADAENPTSPWLYLIDHSTKQSEKNLWHMIRSILRKNKKRAEFLDLKKS